MIDVMDSVEKLKGRVNTQEMTFELRPIGWEA